MITVMNGKDCELVRDSHLIDEPHTRPRVPDDGSPVGSVRVVGDATNVENCMEFAVSNGAGASPEHEITANASGASVRVSDGHGDVIAPGKAESEDRLSEGVRACEESDGSRYETETESRVSEHKVDVVASREIASHYDGGFDGVEGKETESTGDGYSPSNDIKEQVTSSRAEVRNSAVVEWDDQKEQHGEMVMRISDIVGYGFKVGDMVWGKVKSHPWWPGHIFIEAFASPAVRTTRSEGHVLVAFFGDSSYGWFDPAELIHFDPHYLEKSQQMSSRNFSRAVEEATDEVGRRSALGLACRCRNPNNFRPTNGQDYVAVEVPAYEPAGIYSWSQIGKARGCFHPVDTLSFIKQLALAPRSGKQRSIDWIKRRATVLAYRKVVYEEFDETYAQAFGVKPVRPEPKGALDLHPKDPSRAPLSGPLVFAEALGGRKTSSKPLKVKEAKKDKYLFKRRDESSNSKIHHIRQGHTSSSAEPAFVERSTLGAGDYVFQKRVPAIPMKPQIVAGDSSTVGAVLSGQDSSVKDGVNLDKRPLVTDSQELKERMGSDMTSDGGRAFPNSMDSSAVIFQRQDGLKNESAQSFDGGEGFQQSNHIFPSRVEESLRPSHVQDGQSGEPSLPTKAKVPGENLRTTASGLKKAKLLKRPASDLDSGKSIIGEKKKKRKKEINMETGSIHPREHSTARKDGLVVGEVLGKSVKTDANSKEDKQVDLENYVPGGLSLPPLAGPETAELELPQVLSDLQSLALDPFHGVERKSPAFIRQLILRFRSFVYQKSLVWLPPAETEPTSEKVRDLPTSRPPKPPPFRSDDPTKSGRKRGPSDRQEEIATKKLKKISNLKSLSAAKKANLKATEPSRGEAKESPAPAPAKPVRPKMDPPPMKTEEPTMLVMKFPPQTSLPSSMELKARFARFGPLDLSGTRVFWKTYTCRVVFKYKADAQAALKYALGNSSLFGNVSVRYHLRDVEVQGTELPDSRKVRSEEAANETSAMLSPVVKLQRPTLQPLVQLKSCLKKSSNEEIVSSAKGTPRVKFMLGGEESNRNNYNNPNFGDGGTTSVAMDFNSKNFQKVIPSTSSSPPILSFPQLSNPAANNNLHGTETPSSIITHNYNAPPPLVHAVDVSQQMLNLLRECNNVVTNLKSVLGYVPYHNL